MADPDLQIGGGGGGGGGGAIRRASFWSKKNGVGGGPGPSGPSPGSATEASETRARVKITPRGEVIFTRARLFHVWGDFHSCLCFARSTIREENWGLLVV